MQTLTIITPPICEPLSLADAKNHLRVDFTDEDQVIQDFITQARDTIESYCRRVLVPQTWQMTMDGFPGQHPLYTQRGFHSIHVPKPPFQSVVSLQYYDTSGTLQTLNATDGAGNVQPSTAMYGYKLDPGSDVQPARLSPPWARPWPPTRRIPQCVLLQFVAGYANAAAVAAALATWEAANPTATAQQIADQQARLMGQAVPPMIIAAIKLQLAYLYSNRGELTDQKIQALAPGVIGCLSYYANWVA